MTTTQHKLQLVANCYLECGMTLAEIKAFFNYVRNDPHLANTDGAINDWFLNIYCRTNNVINSQIQTILKYVVSCDSIWMILTKMRLTNESYTEFNIKRKANELGFQLLPEQVVVTNQVVNGPLVFEPVVSVSTASSVIPIWWT